MNSVFYNKVINSNHCRSVRVELSDAVLKDKSLFAYLLTIALTTENKNHHKACWILELVCEKKIEWLGNYFDNFCKTLPVLTNESAIRPMSKICLFAATYAHRNQNFLTKNQLQHITEVCFDWLINPDRKVAAKAHAMRTLYILGKSNEWIYPELQPVLEQDYANHTAAYKAAAKDILRKIIKEQQKN